MTRNLTCITCPIGCALTAEVGPGGSDSGITVTGNRCPRGAAYAREEIRAPKRVVTATCGIAAPSDLRSTDLRSDTPSRRAPVKSSVPCPKERINELLADIYQTRVSLPVKAGDTVLADWRGTGIDVVAVRSLG